MSHEGCSYVEGSEGSPCNHTEHGAECYTQVTNCVHTHVDTCYPAVAEGETAPEDPQPICGHVCSGESGCITSSLSCSHAQPDVHDDACGYAATVEAVACNYVCEICAATPIAEGECICDTKCTDTANADCTVCRADGAVLAEVCNGQAEQVTTYLVYTTLNDSNGGTVSGAGSYAPGEEVTISIVPNTDGGYCAAQWGLSEIGGGVISAIEQKTSHTFTMPENAVQISITFAQHSYISHTNLGNGMHDVHCIYCGDIQTASENCVDVHSGGDNVTPDGWCDKCSTAMTYTISFDANTGTGSMAAVTYTYSDNGYTLPANGFTAPENKAFVGWATSANGSVINGSTYPIMANTTLYAIWEDHTHRYSSVWLMDASHHWRECSCGEIGEKAAHSGPAATATTPQTCTVCGYVMAPATGYTLTLVMGNETIGGDIAGLSPVTVSNIAPGTVVDLADHWPKTMEYTVDGQHWYFGEFFEHATGGNIVRSVTVSDNLTVYAIWTKEKQITITFDPNGGSLPYEKVRESTGYEIFMINGQRKPTRSGYDFVGWSLENDGTADSGDTLITADCTLFAVWQQYLPSYDDDYYDPPPANIPVSSGGNYDAILREDVVIVRENRPISGTLDLGKANAEAIQIPGWGEGTIADGVVMVDARRTLTGEMDLTGFDASAVQFPNGAVKEGAEKDRTVNILFPSGTGATFTGSGWAAAEDALRSGESLQISVRPVDAGALPENLTTPPEDDGPYGGIEAAIHTSVFSAAGIENIEDRLNTLGLINGNTDTAITEDEFEYLYHYLTTDELMALRNKLDESAHFEHHQKAVEWLDEMIERDAVAPLNLQELMNMADLTDEQLEFLADMELNDPTIGELRQAGLTLEQMMLLQGNAEELREGASAEEQAQYDALLSWLEEAIAQKELEKENATITSMTLNGLEEYADLTDKQMKILSDMGLQNLDNPSVGQIKKLDLTLEQMELLYAEIDRARSTEYNPEYQAEYGVLLNWLEKAISEKEQENKDTPTYINIGGEKTALVAALEVDVKAVKVSGSTRNIEILADRSHAVAWSTTIQWTSAQQNEEDRFDNSIFDAPETNWGEGNIRAYKVLEDGGLAAKACKVTVNADGTLTLSAMSDGNSLYIFVLEPEKVPETEDTTQEAQPQADYTAYGVQKGDTLWAISRKFGCTVEEIMGANEGLIGNVNAIQVGWELKIPKM